jgi:lipopolysaccharide transport system ATP-binding protein
MSDDIVVKVAGLRKKFCRSLKRSLWYGMNDMVAEVFGGNHDHDRLRKDEFWAVNDISFELRRGQCIGLIGHNGAGKTTLLKMLNGLIKPDHGSITMHGQVGALIALGAGFNPILSGRENIYVNGSVLGLTKAEIDEKLEEIIDFAEIREFIDAPVQTYSSGMAVRLGFAVAVKCKPDILLLDEVLAVGDVGFQAKCFNTLSEFRQRGTAFILVSHNMHQISRYCDTVVYLRRGQIEHTGDVATGIGRFMKDMESPGSSTPGDAPDWSTICGSGKVVFKGASFLDPNGSPISEIKPGDPFVFAVDYQCPSMPVSDAYLDVIIRDKDGVLFQGTSKDFGHHFGLLERSGRFLISFAGIPSNSPDIRFFFSAISSSNGEIYDWKRNVVLRIKNNPMMSGRLAIPVTWQSAQPGGSTKMIAGNR